jgi:hypothetical protein
MTAKTMAEVLAEHQFSMFDEKGHAVCTCDVTIVGMGEDWEEYTAHQEAILTAAGFGLLAEPIVIHVHHDTEAHARSFNEGYEAAVTQGLADDPSLAGDWLDAKLADAKREALEDAADELEQRAKNVQNNTYLESSIYVELTHRADALLGASKTVRARAAAVRGEG